MKTVMASSPLIYNYMKMFQFLGSHPFTLNPKSPPKVSKCSVAIFSLAYLPNAIVLVLYTHEVSFNQGDLASALYRTLIFIVVLTPPLTMYQMTQKSHIIDAIVKNLIEVRRNLMVGEFKITRFTILMGLFNGLLTILLIGGSSIVNGYNRGNVAALVCSQAVWTLFYSYTISVRAQFYFLITSAGECYEKITLPDPKQEKGIVSLNEIKTRIKYYDRVSTICSKIVDFHEPFTCLSLVINLLCLIQDVNTIFNSPSLLSENTFLKVSCYVWIVAHISHVCYALHGCQAVINQVRIAVKPLL
ncbi:Hypothetical protein NTJ_14864 [Nesidiocoris tenuis]|uniref:Gustatory receptor n=1 Tax=Nesidiocoris tenuis TaxID=355587 RepID=A0ABN7BFT7_9HEMI|nr:Hypothetical protein NTJ_14864 [Nesidiocoris tenuis]